MVLSKAPSRHSLATSASMSSSACEPVEPGLLTRVGVGLLDPCVALHEIEPEEQFEILGVLQLILQRQPQRLVDVLAAGRAGA